MLLLAAVVLCLTGFFVVRLLRSDSPPATPTLASFVSTSVPLPSAESTVPAGTPGQPELAIEPQQGYINTLVTVTGRGWWPGEPVFVFLRSPSETEGEGYAYAAAVADDRGSFRTALTFPNEARWVGQPHADVTARGSRSDLESTARLTLVVPTPTNTVPVPTRPPTQVPSQTPLPTETRPPTDTPLPTATPTPELVISDWLGQYYANRSLSGDPALVRNDVNVNFNWGTGSPGAQIPTDQFSARWTRQTDFAKGTYRFVVSADDGVRLWLDGELIVDEWYDGVLENLAVDRTLLRGQHALRLEYYENAGGAMVRLSWSRIEPPTATPTPTSTPISPPTATPSPTETPPPTTAPPAGQPLPDAWQGEYYANPFLGGSPALVRTDAEIQFDWGLDAPADGVPADAFSVRWTGVQTMSAGNYRYAILADDGARLWIDDQLILDTWGASPDQAQTTRVHLEEGQHAFRVEYREVSLEAHIQLWSETSSRGGRTY